jgi:hypothetical protein
MNPMMTEWSRVCFRADLNKIKDCLEQDLSLLDRRESILQLNGILHVVAGAHGRISTIADEADLHSRNIAGHTALHMLTHDKATVMSLQLAEVLIVLGADVNARYGNRKCMAIR